jgi:hypothetical protein
MSEIIRNGTQTIPVYAVVTDKLLADGAVTPATIVRNMKQICYQIIWAANTGTGEFKIQGALVDDRTGSVTWTDLDADPVPVSGTAGSALVDVTSSAIERVRLYYTQLTASTGTHTVLVTAKG